MPAYATDKVSVVVGVYPFSPFVREDKENGLISGATVDLVEALNKLQGNYDFSLVMTSPARRYLDFERDLFDVIMFESKLWGWQSVPISASQVYLKGSEVYIALKQEGRDKSFFDDLNSKVMIGIHGYHYGFAGFNNDVNHLKKNFKMLLTHSNLSSIRMLLGSRGDVAVVTISNLNNYLKDNPEDVEKIMISDRIDQVYNHTILVRDGHSITQQQLNSWLDTLSKNGVFKYIWDKWGLQYK